MKPFTERSVELIRNIPAGRVMTYGQIARLAGSLRGARQVVRILHSMSKRYNLPWYRVINSKGGISFKDDELNTVQRLSLESEGVQLREGIWVNLEKYQYHPDSNL